MPEYNPDTDPRSSNSLIKGYLSSQGLPLTSENVSRALAANVANRGTIKGLVNSSPSTEEEDQAAMAAARGGGARAAAPAQPAAPASADTSAAPAANVPTDDGSGLPLWQQILMGAATGAGYAGSRLLGRNAGKQPGVGETGQPDVRLELNRPALEAPSQPAIVGDKPASLRLGGADVNSGVAGVEQPRLLPSAGRLGQLSGPEAQFQVTGPQAPQQLAAPLDARPTANPDVAIPAPRPAAPDVIPLPGARTQPIVSPEQFQAVNPGATNPAVSAALDKATAGTPTTRARAPRAPRRIPIPIR